MNYDPRIKDYHDIRCFASRNNHECIGMVGYFAEDISEFENLDKCAIGVCCFKDGEEFPFYRLDHTIRRPAHPEKAYPLFCPASITKEETEEKKYRPFTLEEFNERFEYGEYITFRLKDRTRSFCLPYNGNEHMSETENYPDEDSVHLGAYAISLQDLFDDYEYKAGDEWKPFGVEE